MGRIASQMISSFDSSLVDLATAVSAKFSLQQRDVLHLMRSEFRAIRARVSASQRAVVAELPELIDCPPDAPPSQS
jgi:hypothetical protein